jgi:putative ABC transport system permease protein
MMTSCQSSSDVIAIHGVDKDRLLVFRRLRVDPAPFAAFCADTSGALVGEKIARRYGWKLGQNVTLAELQGVSFNVRGIVPTRGAVDDFLIYVGRRFLQEAAGEQGVSHYVLVKPKPGLEVRDVCRAIDDLPLTVQVQSLPEEAVVTTVLDQLNDLVRLSRAVILIIVLVVLIAVGNAISMATRDRLREFGVLRTLGFPRRAVAVLVLGEGVLLGAIGAALGCLVVQGLSAAHLVRSVSTCALTVDFGCGAREWAATLALVVAAAALGSLAPAWAAARTDLVAALRPQE